MTLLVRFILLCLMAGSAAAQRSSPDCLGSHVSLWTNCFGSKSVASGNYIGEWKDGKRSGHGAFTNIDGRKYVGGWKNDLRDGKGIQYKSDGSVIASGNWYEGKLVGSFAIDTNLFPFLSSTQISPAYVPSAHSAEQPNAEIEAERKKRQELEQQLASSKERERITADLDAERRKRQELETELAVQSTPTQALKRNAHAAEI